ncbi:putative F-box protein [Cardamine amara subsp. amara]|uniref:F-box protein n=1 Tax=Cardamine amara subsp. amara TaxID=228776 RepID=A0ABD1C2K4_CARAN
MEIWITTRIEPKKVSWSMFLSVDMKPLTYCKFPFQDKSFFVDEEKKIVLIFDKAKRRFDPSLNVAYIIGNDGYFKRVDLGESTDRERVANLCARMFQAQCKSIMINSPFIN